MEDDDIVLNPVRKVIKCKMILEREDGKINYIDLLRKIKNKEIDAENLHILDDKHTEWYWSDECLGFAKSDCDYVEYITDNFDELDLIDLLVTIIPLEENKDTSKFTAKQELIDQLEMEYMDLEMEIDNCQGCMDGLEVSFAKLRLYKELVKYLGGDIDKHIQELTDKWFALANEKSKREEQEQKRKDEVIKKLPLNILSLMTVDEVTRKSLIEYHDKINEICDILIEMKNISKNSLQE